MCGIVGYAGHRQAAPVLLDGLAKLEYRGYDSAGVCVYTKDGLDLAKAKGRLLNLSEMIHGGADLQGNLGIGHTRWATHGAPSDVNSHPHAAASGKIVVVHNGIIENYQQLKEMLISRGKVFSSETDTEVIANLIELFYDEGRGFREAVRRAMHRMEGSYALGIMCVDYPDTMIAVKKDSPLIFGYGDGEMFIASDVPAILKYTREVSYLNDGDMVVFDADHAEFYNILGVPIEKKVEHIDWEMSAAEKGGYAHFMLKEIHEQPKAIRDTVSPRIHNGKVVLDDVTLTAEYLQSLRKIYIVACGSASYVGNLAKYIFEKYCRVSTEVVLGSEFRYCDPVVDDRTLVLIISQSGETADTLAGLREAKARGARTLAIVNVVGSAIAKAADDVIYTWAGPEIAVATTKAFSTQLAVVYLLALYFAEMLGTMPEAEYAEILAQLQQLPEKLESFLTPENIQHIQYLSSQNFNHRDAYFIGRNLDSAICLEGSLKLKEIAYIHSEAYPAGELKHGPISLIETGTLVIGVATMPELFEKTMSNVKEVKARGADVLGVTVEGFEAEIGKYADYAIVVPKVHPMLQPSLALIPMQIFAYYMALQRGCDVDKPRNLAKSVTVE